MDDDRKHHALDANYFTKRIRIMTIGTIFLIGIAVNIVCWLLLMLKYDNLWTFAVCYLCLIPYLVFGIFTIGIMTDIYLFLQEKCEKFCRNKKDS